MFMFSSRKIVIVWATIILMVFAVGCKKKIPAPPPPPPPVVEAPPAPPPPPPAAPAIAQFAADPASIQRGQSSNLSWQGTGAGTHGSINPLGPARPPRHRRQPRPPARSARPIRHPFSAASLPT